MSPTLPSYKLNTIALLAQLGSGIYLIHTILRNSHQNVPQSSMTEKRSLFLTEKQMMVCLRCCQLVNWDLSGCELGKMLQQIKAGTRNNTVTELINVFITKM